MSRRRRWRRRTEAEEDERGDASARGLTGRKKGRVISTSRAAAFLHLLTWPEEKRFPFVEMPEARGDRATGERSISRLCIGREIVTQETPEAIRGPAVATRWYDCAPGITSYTRGLSDGSIAPGYFMASGSFPKLSPPETSGARVPTRND